MIFIRNNTLFRTITLETLIKFIAENFFKKITALICEV